MKLELDGTEAQQFLDLLDLAVRSGGTKAAQIAVPLVEKILVAANMSEEEK
jgi:hypothetical protein